MRVVLATAYAVNPYKGSEEGTGWNFINEIAKNNIVIAVTRKNNRGDIEKYIHCNHFQNPHFSNIEFLYFDLPKWMLWWKKGPLLSALYFYFWQFFLALWLKKKNIQFDIAHSINFHSNWTPSFLWLLGKPFAWGPVGNHPLIPYQYIKPYGFKAVFKDRMLWFVKSVFWYLDPWLVICRKKAAKIFCVNTQAAEKLRVPQDKQIMMPAVASEKPAEQFSEKKKFTVLSVGRFVPLKGFDLTIKAFAEFYNDLPFSLKKNVELIIIGTGPEKDRLLKIIADAGMQHVIQIKEWMPRKDVIEIFSNSSAYLFPSHEGAGMVVAEALSYGVPVVCLNNYGPGEYVHPRTALRVDNTNYNETVSQLAAKLNLLFTDDKVMKEEQQLALEQYASTFQWSTKGEIVNAVYDEIENTITEKISFTIKSQTSI